MHKRTLRHEVTVHALTSKLWRVLTTSEYTEQFLFEGQYISDWNPGSPIFSKKQENAEAMKEGIVEEVVPGLSLQFTLSAPKEFSNDPVNFSYKLVPDQDGVMLIFSVTINSSTDQLYKFMDEQCKMMLQKIKWLAEYV